MDTQRYYDRLAADYDALYTRPYSQLENEFVAGIAHQYYRAPGLDAGCGTGLGYALLDQPAGYMGIDLSPQMIHQARAKFPGVPFLVGDILHLPFEDDQFASAVMFFAVWSYLSDPDRALAELVRVTRPGALLMIMGLNRFAVWRVSEGFTTTGSYFSRGDG